MTKPKPTYDQTSAEPVLTFVGERVIAGIPAADLSANQLARIAYLRDRSLDPYQVPDAAIDAVVKSLVATGQYQTG